MKEADVTIIGGVMQSILFLSAALSGAPVTDEVQRQLGLLASTINSQTSSPRQYLKSTKAKVEWRSLVMDYAAVTEFTPEFRIEFAGLSSSASGMCGNAMTPWFVANRISVHIRMTAPSGETLNRTIMASDCPVASVPAPASKAHRLQPFSFKGLVAGQGIDRAYLRDCNKEGVQGELSCRTTDGDIGTYSDSAPYVGVYENKLTSLVYSFRRGAAVSIYGAFKEKYGEPCENKIEPWRNGTGAVLENQVVTWCFTTGKLKLRSISTDIRYGDAIYTDDFQAPAPSAPRNF